MSHTFLAKSAALVYGLWGLLHIKAAWAVFELGTTFPADMVQGRLYQSSWNLLFFAVASIVIAVKWNWHNHKTGYVLNLILVSATDIGFVVFILAPGYMPWMPGGLGPLLWLIAVFLSTWALRATPKPVTV